jgi:hypothetical protein
MTIVTRPGTISYVMIAGRVTPAGNPGSRDGLAAVLRPDCRNSKDRGMLRPRHRRNHTKDSHSP